VKIFNLISCIFILHNQILAYEDSDIDGIEDDIDLCPNTSFDKLVDSNGCPENETYTGIFSLELGNDISIDEENNKINNYSFLGNYTYKEWDFSLSNSQQTTYNSDNNRVINNGDLYLNLSYQFNHNQFQNAISFGTKIATADENIGTGQNDYFSSIDLDYFLNEKVIFLSQLSYTIIGDTSSINYQNSLAYSLGIGYMLKNSWYSSFSYDYSKSIYKNTPNYQSISWINSYDFFKNYHISLNYSYGMDELSYPHTFSLKLGVTFE